MSRSQELADIMAQLERYGDVAAEELVKVLWKITDINDDLHHGRDPVLIRKTVDEAKDILETVALNAVSDSQPPAADPPAR